MVAYERLTTTKKLIQMCQRRCEIAAVFSDHLPTVLFTNVVEPSLQTLNTQPDARTPQGARIWQTNKTHTYAHGHAQRPKRTKRKRTTSLTSSPSVFGVVGVVLIAFAAGDGFDGTRSRRKVSSLRSIFRQTASYRLCTESAGRTRSEMRLPVSASRIRKSVLVLFFARVFAKPPPNFVLPLLVLAMLPMLLLLLRLSVVLGITVVGGEMSRASYASMMRQNYARMKKERNLSLIRRKTGCSRCTFRMKKRMLYV